MRLTFLLFFCSLTVSGALRAEPYKHKCPPGKQPVWTQSGAEGGWACQ